MDEDSTEYITLRPMRHDRWSVLILALNVAGSMVEVASDGLRVGAMMAGQHANQIQYDRKFNDITRQI